MNIILFFQVSVHIMSSKVKEWEAIEKPSPCWEHFVQNKNDVKEVKCKKCSKCFSNPTNDTARYHLVNVHSLKIPKYSDQKAAQNKLKEKASSAPKQQSIIAALTPKDTLPLVLSRMVSVDRISFNTIATSVDIQEGLRARGLKVLKSPNSVRENVFSFAADVKQKMTATLNERRGREKFAITLDEYTSINNKR